MAKNQSNKPSLNIRGITADFIPPDPERKHTAHPKDRGTGGLALTPRQEAFARNIAEGLTLVSAYRAAYPSLPGVNAGGDKPNIKAWQYQAASKLLDLPKIQRRVAILLEQKERESLHDAGRIRRFVIERLHHEALTAASPGARVQALGLLGKVDAVGLFKEPDKSAAPVPDGDLEGLKRQLADRLRDLLGNSPSDLPAIEGQAIELKE